MQDEAACAPKDALEGTRQAGTEGVKWADEESNSSEGNSCVRASFRDPRSKLEGTMNGSVQKLINEIRIASEELGAPTYSDEACAELTPLLGKRKLTGKDRDCILGWQEMLGCLHTMIEEVSRRSAP